jgi:paraquat-inducible protein B
MADETDRPTLPQATVVPRSRARISVVWIIPILAAVVALGVAVQRILSEGPTITIVFTVAEGIEAGKTVVKYKDVSIGQVTAVQLSSDHSRVEVTAKMAKSAAALMVEDATFWVVEPRVTLSGVSGLGTLLSGNYIGFEVGKSTKPQRRFTGLETPPVITGGQAGRQFGLRAQNLGSLGIGSPIYYRRLQAGQVIAYALAADGQAIDVKVFVNAPYDRYVTPGTRFWNASGIDFSVGAGGVEVRTQSVVALIAGGLAFETPPFAAKAEPAAADTVFTLYSDQATAMKQPEAIARRFVLYFAESLRGLSVGAPVTLLGLPAGEVTAVGLDLDPATFNMRGRVEIVAFPERLVARLHAAQTAAGETLVQSERQRQAFFEGLVERRGMRAQLRSGSLLTGQLYVAFDFFPDAPRAKVDWNQATPVLPAVPSTIPDLEAKLTSIVAKLDKLPYDEIGADITKVLASLTLTLQDTNKAVNRLDADVTPELKTTLDEVRRVLATTDGMIKNELNATLDEVRRVLATADGTLKNEVNTALEEVRRAIATADRVLKNTDTTLLGKNAPVQQELRDALQEVARAARSLRVLTDYLERHPESLIRGKIEGKP